MKKVLKALGIIIVVIAAMVAILFTYLTIVEYEPAPEESVEVASGNETISVGDKLSVVSFNIGYAAYDRNEDFFMDGGKSVHPENADAVNSNLSGISSIIKDLNADVIFLQEVDIDSKRSYNINEKSYIDAATGIKGTYACNYKVPFVPYPLPPIGKVESGIATYTNLNVGSATRISLPVAFKWPVRIGNLKRCILEERVPIEGTDRELVLLNFHLEAYDDGEGKVAQTKQLVDKISEEYAMGNYVIAGGDFNQSFSQLDEWPILYPDDWMPGYLSDEDLPEGALFAVANNAATCRSLARAYESAETSQTYIIDGFIVTDNLNIDSIMVIDKDFEYSDHNPVRLDVRIKK